MGIFFVGYLCIGTHSRKYKITGASFQRTIIEDDTLFKDKLVYLMEFNVEYCDKELTFMSPALKSTYDVDIRFTDTDIFVAYRIVAGKEFKDIVKYINQNSDDEERFRIFDTRYYLIDDKKVLPKCMKIYLDDKVIDCTVNNDNPVRIKNIVKIVTY